MENSDNITDLKAKNLEQNEILEDLGPVVPIVGKLEKLHTDPCSSKYFEAYNKISYINSSISVELSYNSFNLADGIILKTLGGGTWTGRTVILPMVRINEYKIRSLNQISDEIYNIQVGWTEHTYTHPGYEGPNGGSPKFDKSFAIASWHGGYFGDSASSSMEWDHYDYMRDDNYTFWKAGSTLIAANSNRKFSWTVGSNTREFDATSYFSGNLYPALSLFDGGASWKIFNIKFGDMQC